MPTEAHLIRPDRVYYGSLQDDAEELGRILLSLEACMACLQVLAAPGMPKQVYKEELIDRLVGLVRFQLLHNVLVFHDAALCQAHRPELNSPGAALPSPRHLCTAPDLLFSTHIWLHTPDCKA